MMTLLELKNTENTDRAKGLSCKKKKKVDYFLLIKERKDVQMMDNLKSKKLVENL